LCSLTDEPLLGMRVLFLGISAIVHNYGDVFPTSFAHHGACYIVVSLESK
jgi:hypothetical protein